MPKEYTITANGVKLILTILFIVGILIGVVKGYTIYSETTKLNSVRYEKIEPRVNKNEKDIIKIVGKIEPIGKRQERMCVRQEKMDEKLDKILDKIK